LKVKLIAYTPECLKLIYAAIKTSSSKDPGSEFLDKPLTDKKKELIKTVIDWGHLSVIEHANFTFSIEGISRAASHQLVRHRLASYTQQSQRYVLMDELPVVIPPSIQKNKKALDKFEEIINRIKHVYNELTELGIAKEDARYILPNATTTNLIVTMNARELLHFFQLRLCDRSQWEIRKIAQLMLNEVNKIAPELFLNAKPPCETCKQPCPTGRNLKNR